MSTRTRFVAATAAATMISAALATTGASAATTGTAASAPTATAGATAFEGEQGTYQSVNPNRILDTRTGNGAPKALVGAGREISLLVAGRGGVPGGVSAVVLNLTAVGPSTNTFLTAYPSGTTRPSTSSLNVRAYTNRANLVTVPVGTDGRVRIYNSTGTTNVLADVLGFYNANTTSNTGQAGSQYYTVTPERWYDSRADAGAIPSGDGVRLWGDYAEFNSMITAFAANITVLQGSISGYVAAGPTDAPGASTVNYSRGQVVANMSVVPVTLEDGLPTFYVMNKGPGSVQIIVDVVGVYTVGEEEGLRFRPLAPTRIMDTRSGVGGPVKPLGAGEARQQLAPASVAGDLTYALVANATAAGPTSATYVTAYSNDIVKPAVSNLNAAKGETAANAAFIEVGMGNLFRVHNAAGSTPMIMDVTGTFEYHTTAPAGVSATERGARERGTQRSAPDHGAARL
ncbi:hypothetical protein [Knoellia subterranea]|uniref:Uncharacterized protein n=1 Tax=Knoellia subterranea KCTC 19937 TaxID=1385521 RepID=A0A0A0JSA8_9MICO|nr:hypothetical protein [Knoellia subterranea]KGN39574.1 hypothetical protein N803_01280 [Knoellia subterranea KCTC 19937]